MNACMQASFASTALTFTATDKDLKIEIRCVQRVSLSVGKGKVSLSFRQVALERAVENEEATKTELSFDKVDGMGESLPSLSDLSIAP